MVRCTLGHILAQRKIDRTRPYTQVELAKVTGLSPNTISGLVNDKTGRFDKPVLDALCRVLDVTPGDLLVYIPDEPRLGTDSLGVTE